MIIARILGTVVSSQKDERLLGKKLLIVRPVNVDGSDTTGYVVAVDTVGAGYHERVLVVAGSSARLAQGMKDVPVDAAIVGGYRYGRYCQRRIGSFSSAKHTTLRLSGRGFDE